MSSQLKITLKQASKVLITTLLLTISSVSLANNEASIHSLSGFVTITEQNGDVRRAQPTDKLHVGDTINTGNESQIIFILGNGKRVELGSLESYTIKESDKDQNSGEIFAGRSLSNKSPTLSTATSAGGGVADAPTTPAPGGSPTD